MNRTLLIVVSIVVGVMLGALSNWIYDLLRGKIFPHSLTLKRAVMIVLTFLPLVIALALIQTQLDSSPDNTSLAPTQAADASVFDSESANGILDNWVAPFKFDFGPGFWSLGKHEYTIGVDCAGTARDYSASKTFRVSESAELLQGEVYLRLEGVHKVDLWIDPVDVIHPLQRTAGLVSLSHLTQTEAEAVVNGGCKGSIGWDDGLPRPLVPQKPYRVVEDIDIGP